MKTKMLTSMIAVAALPLTSFAQPPPPPPPSSIAPVAPGPGPVGGPRDKGPKVSVTFMGVETSEVPAVLSEQLGLAKGFGLVVDYVTADGPAAAAGLHQNDILKMLNDQILTDPEQLSKLVRSFPDGTTVTFTVIRKGAEMKLPIKLGKKEISESRIAPGFEKHWRFDNGLGSLDEGMKDLRRELDSNQGVIRDAVGRANAEAMRARDEALRAADEARAERHIRIRSSNENGTLRTTKIDLGKAEIVLSDNKGELKISTVDGHKVLTAKDPQGRLLFSGPIENADQLAKVPTDVRNRYEKLEQKDLPPAPSLPPEPNAPLERDDAAPQPIDQVSLYRQTFSIGTTRI